MAKKHFENIIGKIIYGTLLFMPLLNVLGTSIYAIANKNAYESYYGETINQQDNILLTTNDSFELNQKYIFDSNTYTTTGQVQGAYARGITFSNFKILSIANFTLNVSEPTFMGMYIDNNNNLSITLKNDNNSQIIYFNGNQLVFEFTYLSDNFNSNFKTTNTLYKVEYKNYSFLDNAFEYGIYKTENSPYYNWTTETAINDVIHQTTTTLGINNSFVDLLLTYWLLMTIIYVIYDLGLMLIQIAHKKVHKICDKD